MINTTLLHVHTFTHTYHTCWVCTILIEGERRDFFFGMDHNTWCQLFSRTVGKHRGVAIPHPSPPQTVLCQCYQNKWAYFIFLWIDPESFLFSWAGSWNIGLSCTKKKLQVLMQLYITASCETNKCYSCESHTSDHILVILSIRKMIKC